jgi:tRNA-specific 2-thiouridylase
VPGPIENDAGEVIGEHRGLALYTLGQRSGLGIGGRVGSAAAPWYVADKDIGRNALIVVQDQNHPLLLSDAFDVEQMHWLNPLMAPPAAGGATSIKCMVKTRYRQRDLVCSVRSWGAASPADAPTWRVDLEHPASAVTPGQYAVFYQGEVCLGGGVIAGRFNSRAAHSARAINYNSQFSVEGS